ncbi:MAG TPA: DUF302 domain-containing protein [Anaeromyxobacteraceae bacterium]|nr:DUF302 domain-containing protein [Anaeromyxobacteraceae bacterium]
MHPGSALARGRGGVAVIEATVETSSGVTDVRSTHPVTETLDRLERLARANGLLVFARIDFSRDAAAIGLALPATQMLIFGNPRAGTPLMLSGPRSALDLPLKALAWEDGDGKVWLSYNDPEYVVARHGLPRELAKNLAAAGVLVAKAADETPLPLPG